MWASCSLPVWLGGIVALQECHQARLGHSLEITLWMFQLFSLGRSSLSGIEHMVHKTFLRSDLAEGFIARCALGPVVSFYLGRRPVISEHRMLYVPLMIISKASAVLGTAQAAWDLLDKRSEIYSGRPRSIMAYVS